MFKEISEINGEDLSTKEILYYKKLNFHIVPIGIKNKFDKSNPDDIYFTTTELAYLFSIKVNSEDLDSILKIKKIMHPTSFISKQEHWHSLNREPWP